MGYQGLPVVTMAYKGLQEVTGGYNGLRGPAPKKRPMISG